MIEILFFIFTVGLLALLIPGPDFFLIFKNSLSQSRGYAWATAIGISTGILFHTIYCVMGLGWVISKNVLVFQTLKYLGAGYLIYLGIQILLNRNKKTMENPKNDHLHLDKSSIQGFLEGFLCNALNIKASLFMISVFTIVITPDTNFLYKTFYGIIFIGQNLIYWSLLVFALQQEKLRNIFLKIQPKAQIVFALVPFLLAFHLIVFKG